jgi:hypothetical protein
MSFPGKLWPSQMMVGSLGHLLEVIDYQAFCDIRKARDGSTHGTHSAGFHGFGRHFDGKKNSCLLLNVWKG